MTGTNKANGSITVYFLTFSSPPLLSLFYIYLTPSHRNRKESDRDTSCSLTGVSLMGCKELNVQRASQHNRSAARITLGEERTKQERKHVWHAVWARVQVLLCHSDHMKAYRLNFLTSMMNNVRVRMRERNHHSVQPRDDPCSIALYCNGTSHWLLLIFFNQ